MNTISTMNGDSLISKLSVFVSADDLPLTVEDCVEALSSGLIKLVKSHALGPSGTNILRAAEQWHREMNIDHKAKIVLCDTPEQAVMSARANKEEGVLDVFWTCAVYFREHELFFGFTDTLPFLFQVNLPLDEMQLACRPEMAVRLLNTDAMSGCKVLSHPSPASLVKKLPVVVIPAKSNADAAVRCSHGEAEACITTEAAQRLHGLVTLHRFGSPPMVFFGGISTHRIDLLRRGLAEARAAINVQSVPGSAANHGLIRGDLLR
jgi:hypothetical protein